MKKGTLTINRSKWRTGGQSKKNRTGKGFTELLNTQGYMCCLGFECLRNGLTTDDILQIGSPEDANNKTKSGLYDKNKRGNTTFANDAIEINDDENTTPREKEKLIRNHFATKGVKVRFINSYE